MLTGHAYARALRAHLISSVAISTLLLEKPGCLDNVDLDSLCRLHKALLKTDDSTDTVVDDACLRMVTEALRDAMKDATNESRTGKLWINYLEQVSLLRLFIRAERTGDCALHL